MLKLCHQHGPDCLLAAIAMATDRDIREFRATPLAKEWRTLMESQDENTPEDYTTSIGKKIADLEHLLLTENGFIPPEPWPWSVAVPGANPKSRYSLELLHRNDIRGTGILAVNLGRFHPPIGRTHWMCGHAVAYQDGYIYDGDPDAIYTVASWTAMHREMGYNDLAWITMPVIETKEGVILP